MAFFSYQKFVKAFNPQFKQNSCMLHCFYAIRHWSDDIQKNGVTSVLLCAVGIQIVGIQIHGIRIRGIWIIGIQIVGLSVVGLSVFGLPVFGIRVLFFLFLLSYY
jgi:hypothetical protein